MIYDGNLEAYYETMAEINRRVAMGCRPDNLKKAFRARDQYVRNLQEDLELPFHYHAWV